MFVSLVGRRAGRAYPPSEFTDVFFQASIHEETELRNKFRVNVNVEEELKKSEPHVDGNRNKDIALHEGHIKEKS